MTAYRSSPRDRIGPAIAAIAVQALLGYALVVGLAVHFTQRPSDDLKLFGVTPEPPPPPPEKVVPDPVRNTRPEGEASPPNLRSKATEIAAPPPVIPIPLPAPVVAAPKPLTGNEASTGAAPVPGPGTGAGGIGDGTGSGGSGDGDGGGWEDETPPRQIRGRITDSDFPDDIVDANFDGTVGVRYGIGTDGRVTDCEVARSSGNPRLDVYTCSLIERRFRFRPALDGQGRPVPSTMVQNHSWRLEIEPPEEER
ncbi:energy transducer TonB [Sphingomonas sp. DT-204]|uniref:energy transducer TonB n=1 Tax=Sphingomonas sp. DT-204 TaxID=3396166 RepID=UPI003F1A5C48